MRLISVNEYLVRVVHLDNHYTMVDVINDQGVRLNMPNFHIPREVIPFHLRRIGSRFMLRWRFSQPETGDSIEYIRAYHMANDYEVVALQ